MKYLERERLQSNRPINDVSYVLSEPLFLDLDGKRHEVKERCEGEFMRTTAVLRESDCTYAKLCNYAMADFMDIHIA